MRLDGKFVVVTGGNRGIGFAIAAAALAAGANVLITGRDTTRLDVARVKLSEHGDRVAVFVGDATSIEDIDRLVDQALERWQRIDVLVNNVGLYSSGPFLEVTPEDWDAALRANLTGPFLMSQRVGRTMAERDGGSIINIGSIISQGVERNSSAYSAAKAALSMLTKSIAVELGPHGVRCNSISPGYVSTEQVENEFPEVFAFVTNAFARAPIRRIVTPAEVAGACVFLASDTAAGITGIDLRVDGGLLADLYIGSTFPPE